MRAHAWKPSAQCTRSRLKARDATEASTNRLKFLKRFLKKSTRGKHGKNVLERHHADSQVAGDERSERSHPQLQARRSHGTVKHSQRRKTSLHDGAGGEARQAVR